MRINLRFGISVHTRDGRHVGTLERLVIAPDDRPLALVLYPGRALSGQHLLTVPANLVTGVSMSRIQIAANPNELTALAEKYASDAQGKFGWELAGGAAIVDAANQTVGKVQGAVVNGHQCTMSHMMVRHQAYHLVPQNRLIPAFLIARVTLHAIQLYIAADYDLGLALSDAW